MQNRGLALTMAAAIIVAIACSDDATETVNIGTNTNLVTFKATMTPGAENPPITTSSGSGTFTATLDTVTNIFTYDVTFTGLTSGVNNGHIHAPAANATINAGTTVNYSTLAGSTFSLGATSGAAHGVVTLNAANAITATINGDSLKKLLFAGLTYSNVHTTNNPGGEIRGTITKQ